MYIVYFKVTYCNQQYHAVYLLVSKTYFLKSTPSNSFRHFLILRFILIFLRHCSQEGHRQKKADLSQIFMVPKISCWALYT